MRYCNCFYCRYFLDLETCSHSVTFPVRNVFWKLWFFLPRKLKNYNTRDCRYFIPDWWGGRGTRVRPFLGYVLTDGEEGVRQIAWWRLLRKYKDIEKTPIEVARLWMP